MTIGALRGIVIMSRVCFLFFLAGERRTPGYNILYPGVLPYTEYVLVSRTLPRKHKDIMSHR